MAESKSGYKVSVSLVDGVTGPLRALNKNLAAAQLPFKRLQGQIEKFKELSGINKVTDGIKAMVGWVLRGVSAMASMIPIIGALTGAATLAGVFKLVGAWANLGTKLLNTTAIVGGTVTQLQQMQNAARLAGSSAEDMTSSIQGLGQAAQDALSGKNAQASALFQAYGISVRKAGYQAKSGAEMMGDAFEIIRKLHDKGASPAVIQNAMGILGLSSGMTRFAIQGKEGLEKYNKMAEHFGLMSPKAAEQADLMRESFGKLTMAVEGFFNSVAEKVGPVLTPLINQLAEWIAVNRGWIATRIADYIDEFAIILKGMSFTDVVDGARKFGETLERISNKLEKIVDYSTTFLELWGASKALAILKLLGVPAPIRAILGGAVLGFKAQQSIGEKEATVGQKAEQLGMATHSVDAWGHAISYQDDKGIYMPEDVERLYKEKFKQGKLGPKHLQLPPDIEEEVRAQARRQGVDEDHIARMARMEGGWKNDSSAGAMGVMQLMPKTAADLHVDPRDRHQNIEGGVRYFKQMLELFHGNYAAATAAYNAGPNNLAVQRYARTGHTTGLPDETKMYLRGVLGDQSRGTDVPGPPPLPPARTPDDVNKGLRPIIHFDSSTSPIGPTSLRSQEGNLQVTIRAPSGWPVTAQSRGNVVRGAPRVVSPMAGIG